MIKILEEIQKLEKEIREIREESKIIELRIEQVEDKLQYLL